jgi:23S rRNA (uracil1939-C5)-methyltransferase
LQHAADDFVAAWKAEVVQTALSARGLSAEIRPTLSSPPKSRRRAVFSVRRTKKGTLAGFHRRASDIIVEIPDCQLLHPELMRIPEIAGRLAMIGGSRKGELGVTATVSESGLDLAVVGGKSLDGPLMSRLAQESGQLGLSRLAWGDEIVVTAAAPSQLFGTASVTPPPGAFLQATKEGELALLRGVESIVGRAPRGIDLFAGCGTFTLPLARTAMMHAVESEADMLSALGAGWRQAMGLKQVTTEPRDLFRDPILADELKYDFAVIDPPRAGAEAQCRALAESTIPTIAFVSCNPVTFARDADILISGGYTLNWVQPVDQFRWSAHVELVASFTRN